MKTYTKLSQVEHVLKRPGMYIGSIEKETSIIDIFHNNKIIEKEIEYSTGLYKIYDEIISNSYDEAIRNKNVKNIHINIIDNSISIMNDGSSVQAVIDKKNNVYLPELIFGHLLTSSTFTEEKRITAGTHGLGAKLTNIYSKRFEIDIGDSKNKLQYTQIFENNLSKINKPKIIKYSGKDYVKITFTPDYEKFGLDKLTDDIKSLFQKRAYDIAGILSNVKLYFNEQLIEINSFQDYAKLYFDKSQDYVTQKCGSTSQSEFIITNSTHDKFKHVSFVNGVHTKNGGKHIDHIIKQIIDNMQKAIKKKYKTAKIRDSFIKDKITILLNSVIVNPVFSSQTKDALSSNVSDDFCQIKNNTMKSIIDKLDLTTEIISLIKARELTELEKNETKRKKTKLKGVNKLYDANYAGTSKSKDCSLILTEGDSAKTMAISGLSAIKKGNDHYGVFPLKGKLLNVREASHKQIIENEEFNSIKQILGLKMGHTYTKDNIHELRYGSIILMMDADPDGSHIKGLFLNIMDYYFPSLLKLDNFVKVLITPVVKITKQKEVIPFYSLTDFEKWKSNTKEFNNWKIKYYKGLGTSTSEEAREYFNNLDKHLISFSWDNKADSSIILAFSKKQADNRKKWLSNYDRDEILDIKNSTITISDFIHKELKHFSNEDNIRSIPHLLDGFKPSHRKILYTLLNMPNNELKVSQLTGLVSQKSAYHHGENSLVSTIISMAQNFIGSNNLNTLLPIGQFGSRLMGGKDSASARYIFTKLNDTMKLIFNKDDNFQLDFLNDDGFLIEPEHYLPIVPMLLINGSEGIGSGYSTFIPKFKLEDVKNSILSKLENDRFLNLEPGYENFTGLIQKVDKTTYQSIGKYKLEKDKIIITELPIGVWTEDYNNYLDNMSENERWFKTYKNNCTEKDILFEIKTNDFTFIEKLHTENKLIQILRLAKNINLTNMHCFSSDGKLKKYNTINDILNEYYDFRLEAYQKRKIHLIKTLKENIQIENSKLLFIKAVISNKLKLYQMDDDKIIKEMNKMKLYKNNGYDYLLNMSIRGITKNKINDLDNKINELKKSLNKLNKMSNKDLWIQDLKII
jgi:DNA topoisomerase II